MRLLLTVLTWLPSLLTVLCPEIKSSFLLGDFRGLLCSQVSVVFPSVSVSCVPKCLCLLCSQVFLFLACPSVCVCCAPKCSSFLRAQAFVSVLFPSVCVCCVPKCFCLLRAHGCVVASPSVYVSCVPKCTIQFKQGSLCIVCAPVSFVAPKT